MKLSVEQQHILDRVKAGNNIAVDAVAGTGKTTLILSIADEIRDKQILQMTYNKSLKFEVREKIENAKIENLNVHTFHSLAVCYYVETAYVDNEIRKIIVENKKPSKKIPKIDVLVLDESQDMTFLYFQLMCKFLFDMGNQVQLIILGDYMQGLYEFKGSDVRYLTFADCIWEKHPLLRTPAFELCSMKMSYRITNQMRHFVNNELIGEDRMNSCRDDQPVQYIRNSRYNIEKIVYAEIVRLFELGVNPNDIFVLGPSVKGERSHIRKLENMLVEKNIPCHVPMMESSDIDQRVIDGKVVFSTFHTVKGRQRKYVFVVGMDHSYFKFYARNLPRDICPNTIYVASTRASQGLYILESDSRPDDRPLDCLKMSHVEMKEQPYIQFRGQHKTFFTVGEERDMQTHIRTTPTELIKFIPEDTYQYICGILENIFTIENQETYEIDMPSLIQTKSGHFEEISDLNGMAIPCIYYDFLRSVWYGTEVDKLQDSVLYELIDINKDDIKEKNKLFLQTMIEKLPEKIESVKEYLFMANINQAIQESLYFKLKQIEPDEYVWLSDDTVDACKNEYRRVIGPDCQNKAPKIEEYIIIGSDDASHKYIDEFTKDIVENKVFRFSARADIITENTLWELKCTSKLSTDHMLQLVIYAWLWKLKNKVREQEEEVERDFKLFNVKTGELMRMEGNMEDLNNIMKALFNSRYNEIVPKHDELFISDCNDYITSCSTEQQMCEVES